jgi:motility quorum-sensing regulator / GCU-specific mRNA interferase toxin
VVNMLTNASRANKLIFPRTRSETRGCVTPSISPFALGSALTFPGAFSARSPRPALGLDLSDMLAVIVALTPADFYKSMTTHIDHTIWQDVYRPSTQSGDVYLKLSVIEDVLIVSLKEL